MPFELALPGPGLGSNPLIAGSKRSTPPTSVRSASRSNSPTAPPAWSDETYSQLLSRSTSKPQFSLL